MVILGISAFGHDAAAAIMVDGELLAACEEERLSRVKHDGSFPDRSIAYCLGEARVRREEVDYVAFYHDPWLHMGKRFRHLLTHLPGSISFLKSHGADLEDWRAMFGVGRRFPTAEFVYVEHHLAHAASAFYPSPFEEAAILSVDGMGEWDTTLMALGRDREIEKLGFVSFPHSLGIYYEALTQYLGFRIHNDEYKVMGLSAYGGSRYRDGFGSLIRHGDDGRFELDLSMFTHHLGSVPFYSSKFVARFGMPRGTEDKLNARHADIASAGQRVLEDALILLADAVFRMTGCRNLCLAGGVGLNCAANGRLTDESPFDNIHVQPASHDSGCAVGCCYYVYHNLLGNGRTKPLPGTFLGPGFSNSDVETVLKTSGIEYRKADYPERDCARMLSSGRVIGWYQGRMEFGPRALGARSILADPRKSEMKRRVNRVKRRESFSPFAPSVLRERTGQYFETDRDSPYMLFTRKVNKDAAETIPSVTHVDGTARLQTVSRGANAGFHRLIEEFEGLTGVPVILNTSLNLKGQPIACTPGDALGVFMNSELDGLFMGNYYVGRR